MSRRDGRHGFDGGHVEVSTEGAEGVVGVFEVVAGP